MLLPEVLNSTLLAARAIATGLQAAAQKFLLFGHFVVVFSKGNYTLFPVTFRYRKRSFDAQSIRLARALVDKRLRDLDHRNHAANDRHK